MAKPLLSPLMMTTLSFQVAELRDTLVLTGEIDVFVDLIGEDGDFGMLRKTAASASSSARVYTDPEGYRRREEEDLCFGVMAFSSWTGVSLKSLSIEVCTSTTFRGRSSPAPNK